MDWGFKSGGRVKINSDTLGNLTIDGTANSAIALIIAPGPALTLSPNSNQIAAGCVARTQNRSGDSGPSRLSRVRERYVAGGRQLRHQRRRQCQQRSVSMIR